MTSSGTYAYSLSNGDGVIAAFERLQIRMPSLRQEHFMTARRELNLLFSEWSNKQVNLWKVQLNSQLLTSGTATYTLDPSVVMVLDAYVSINQGLTTQTDRIVMPMSRSTYAAMSQKKTSGQPTSFWFDRLITPTVTLWPVPDNTQTYYLNYYCCLQQQDAALRGGETPDVPYRWYDAMIAGLAYRLARIYMPTLEATRGADADKAWMTAAGQDTENVNLSIGLNLKGYYPR